MSSATADVALEGRDTTPGDVPAAIDRWRYRAQHYGLTASLAIPGRLMSLVLFPRQRRVDAEVLSTLQRRYEALLSSL